MCRSAFHLRPEERATRTGKHSMETRGAGASSAPQRVHRRAIRQPMRPAELVVDVRIGGQAEGMEQSGGEIGGGHRAVRRLGGMTIARAVNLAAANAGAGQRDGENAAPMI